MQGDERVRFCLQCRQSVYDVSGMTGTQAETLITGRTGQVCLRLFRRADGRVMARDCPVGVFQAARRRLAKTVGACAFLGVLLFGWTMSRPQAVREARERMRTVENWIDPAPECVMGEPIWIPPTVTVPADDDDDE
jgi:hypothetical protein